MNTIKKYLQKQSIKTEERTTEEQPKHYFNNNNNNNNNQYDLLLCSIYIISENTDYSFNDIVKLLDLEDIIYNENIN